MKVLIVEDEQKLAAALQRGLVAKGYAADVLHDGKEALERITLYKDDYDVVILDLLLPGIDGHTICKQVREKGIKIPILVLTALDQTESKVDVLNSGADDYLAKPFSFEELDARLKALLRRPAETAQVVLKVNDIELNPSERTVYRAGKPIQLTLKEFSLLEYFMRNLNRVINREELLNHLWDFNYTSFFSNSLDVHVKNLRKKIDYESEPSVIETIRGIGYKIKE